MPATLARAAAACVACCWFAAGCGAGGGSHAHAKAAAAGTPSKATKAGADGRAQLTVAQARALATEVNIVPADVPGFSVSAEHQHEHKSATEQRWEREMLSCAGAERFPEHGLVEISSPKLQRERGIDSSSVQSKLTLARSSTLALEELAALKSNRGERCISRFLGLLLRSETPAGAAVGRVHVSIGVPPADGASGSFALRVSSALTVSGVRVPVYLDLLGFAQGPAEIVLQTSGVPDPFPAALEEHLYLLLLQRTRTHSG